jgi:hypothetical protein
LSTTDKILKFHQVGYKLANRQLVPCDIYDKCIVLGLLSYRKGSALHTDHLQMVADQLDPMLNSGGAGSWRVGKSEFHKSMDNESFSSPCSQDPSHCLANVYVQ